MGLDEEDDIAADIAAAFEAPATGAAIDPAAAEPTGDAGETQAAEPAPGASADGGGDAENGDNRPRDPATGKFVAKAAETAQDSPKPEVAAEPERTIRPPSSWSAAAKAVFVNLDPVVQQEVLKREKEIEDGKAQWDTKAEKFNRFDALVAPHRDRLTLAGLDEFGYLNALIRADEMLRTNPQMALPQILRMYGLETPQAQQQGFQPNGAYPAQGYQPQSQPDPVVQTLQRQLSDLQTRLEAQDQQREQETKSEIDRELEAFAKDPANLYYENVRSDMAALLRAGLAGNLKEAYDKACQMRDDIRPLLSRAKAEPEKKNGQKAGVSVTGAPGLAQPKPTPSDPSRSIEDDIRAAIEEVAGVV